MHAVDPHVDSTIGRELHTVRMQLGLSQAELAQLLNTTQQTIGRWEQGHSPQPRFLRAIRDFLEDNGARPGSGAAVLPFAPVDGGFADQRYSPLEQRVLDAVISRVETGIPLGGSEAKLLDRLLRVVDQDGTGTART